MLNQYELMVIFTPILSESEFSNKVKEYTTFITKNKGEVVYSNPWGLKSLAYPIDKKTTGLYLVLEFKALGEMIEKFKVQISRDESIMRHMFTSLDKYAIEYNLKKRQPKTSHTLEESNS